MSKFRVGDKVQLVPGHDFCYGKGRVTLESRGTIKYITVRGKLKIHFKIFPPMAREFLWTGLDCCVQCDGSSKLKNYVGIKV